MAKKKKRVGTCLKEKNKRREGREIMGYLLFWCSMVEENKITLYRLSFALPVFSSSLF